MVDNKSGIIGRARDWAAVRVEQMSALVIDWGGRHVIVEDVASAGIRSDVLSKDISAPAHHAKIDGSIGFDEARCHD